MLSSGNKIINEKEGEFLVGNNLCVFSTVLKIEAAVQA